MSEHETHGQEENEREKYLKTELKEERSEEAQLKRVLEELREREEKTEEEIRREEKHHPSHEFSLIFIINGESFEVTCSPAELLRRAVEKALHESGNTGRREISEWEVRNEEGVLLEMGREIKKLGLKKGEQLFLSLKVAAGGAYAG
jgi:hypothetical protein